jgi:tRNA uridine 5-carbamoylmethylation protein Kti12
MVKSVSIPHSNGSIDNDDDDDDVIVHTTNDGLIIVDDIMYLRSMRRELYVITRDHGVPLVIVWMKSCLDVCLARNRSRNDRINTSNDDNNTTSSCCIDRHITESIHSIDRRVKLVTDDTILRIHGAFEEPTSEFIFDRHHIVVDSDSVDRYLMVDMSVFLCVCMYVCMYMFVFVYVCMCVCMFV